MKARVFRNHDLAGELERREDGTYRYMYREDYLKDPSKPAISLTLPKRADAYESKHLFPFFFNMLSEGVNLKLQSRALKIDEEDYFQLLLSTAQYDTIGAVRVEPIDRDA